jgi:probable rRNA maturation factor
MNTESPGSESTDDPFQVEFHFDDVECSRLPESDQANLRTAVIATLHSEGVNYAEISVAIVSSTRMRQLNAQYLQHDYDTDVLSFCLETEEDLGFLLGQLIVSLDFAQRQCDALGQATRAVVPLVHELALYLVHGSLHLVGYDDHEPEQREEMRRRERLILGPLGMSPVWDGCSVSTDDVGSSEIGKHVYAAEPQGRSANEPPT